MGSRIFVFGSNLAGIHGAGSAAKAYLSHGAIRGKGVGPQGSSYAIPTKDATVRNSLPLPLIRLYVLDFIEYAKSHPELTFDVVKIGCGLAGFVESEIAPMFAGSPANVNLPEGWPDLC